MKTSGSNRLPICFCCGMEACGLGLWYHPANALHKAIPISIIIKYVGFLNAPADDVVQSTGCVYARFSWHRLVISYRQLQITQKNNPVPIFRPFIASLNSRPVPSFRPLGCNLISPLSLLLRELGRQSNVLFYPAGAGWPAFLPRPKLFTSAKFPKTNDYKYNYANYWYLKPDSCFPVFFFSCYSITNIPWKIKQRNYSSEYPPFLQIE